jgi:hypothetical protein
MAEDRKTLTKDELTKLMREKDFADWVKNLDQRADAAKAEERRGKASILQLAAPKNG